MIGTHPLTELRLKLSACYALKRCRYIYRGNNFWFTASHVNPIKMKRFWRVIHWKLGFISGVEPMLIVALCQFRWTTTLCLVLTTYWIVDSGQTDAIISCVLFFMYIFIRNYVFFVCFLTINKKNCKITGRCSAKSLAETGRWVENKMESNRIKTEIEHLYLNRSTRDKI